MAAIATWTQVRNELLHGSLAAVTLASAPQASFLKAGSTYALEVTLPARFVVVEINNDLQTNHPNRKSKIVLEAEELKALAGTIHMLAERPGYRSEPGAIIYKS